MEPELNPWKVKVEEIWHGITSHHQMPQGKRFVHWKIYLFNIYIYIYKREKKNKNQTCVESADQVRIKCNFQFTMLNEGTHVTIIFKSLRKIHFCNQSQWKFNRICSALFQVLFGTSTVPHISGGLEMTKKYVKRPVQVKRNEGLEHPQQWS